jgi:cell shape-determining protein MreC
MTLSQLEVLQSLARSLEHENTTLREELDTTRGLLHKTKEANKGFRMTVNQLSRIVSVSSRGL